MVLFLYAADAQSEEQVRYCTEEKRAAIVWEDAAPRFTGFIVRRFTMKIVSEIREFGAAITATART